MSKAIRDRVEQEAVQRRSALMGMMEKASDLTPPDLPLTLEECPQTDPGILTGDRSNLGGISCSGPQKRELRLLEFGQSEKDLWRGAPATIRRRGTQLLAGSVGSMDQIVKLIETPIALMKKPDTCTPEIYNAYLTVQRRARNGVGLKIEQMDKHLRGVIRNLCPKKTEGYAPVGSAELERQKKLCDQRATDCLERWADEQRERLSWFKEDDLALIKDAGGPELQVLTEPPFEFGWRTGREALLGEKRTVEEAIVSRRILQDARRAAPGPAPPVPQVTKPAVPKAQSKPPGPASLSAGEMELELAPEDSQDHLLDRLPLGWEKKMAAVDRSWFLGDQNFFLTDVELKTYVQTMGWADSSNSSADHCRESRRRFVWSAEGKTGSAS